jgi:hypothetical protein
MMNRYTVTRDARIISTHDTENEAWRRLLDIQGMSVHRAVTEEGYEIIYPDGTKVSDTYKKESK